MEWLKKLAPLLYNLLPRSNCVVAEFGVENSHLGQINPSHLDFFIAHSLLTPHTGVHNLHDLLINVDVHKYSNVYINICTYLEYVTYLKPGSLSTRSA